MTEISYHDTWSISDTQHVSRISGVVSFRSHMLFLFMSMKWNDFRLKGGENKCVQSEFENGWCRLIGSWWRCFFWYGVKLFANTQAGLAAALLCVSWGIRRSERSSQALTFTCSVLSLSSSVLFWQLSHSLLPSSLSPALNTHQGQAEQLSGTNVACLAALRSVLALIPRAWLSPRWIYPFTWASEYQKLCGLRSP